MILNEKLLADVKELNQVDYTGFEKTVNFTFSYMTKEDTQTKLSEVLEIEEEVANNILNSMVKLVMFLTRAKMNLREFRLITDMINLDRDKKEVLLKKLESNLGSLKKTLHLLDEDTLPTLKKFDWRMDLQVASRSYQEELKPRIFLNFSLLNHMDKEENKVVETNFANLKNLHEELSNALKVVESAKHKKLRKVYH